MTGDVDLVAFLRARLDEDERDAHDVHEGSADAYLGGECVCDYPARALREVEAKRTILDGIADADPHGGYITAAFTAWDVLRAMLTVYSDHPGFNPAWLEG